MGFGKTSLIRGMDKLLAFFKGSLVALEFRTPGWYTGRAIEGMKERGMSLVSLDMQELKDLPLLMDVVTAHFSFIRLHGRNGEAWNGSDEVAQYDYLYHDNELEAWVDRIKRIAVQVDRILVYFNNHARGQAVKNAQTLVAILDKAGLSSETGGEKDMTHGKVHRAVCHLNIVGYPAATTTLQARRLTRWPFVITKATGDRSLVLDLSPEVMEGGICSSMVATAERKVKDLTVLPLNKNNQMGVALT
jgi:hypothetical protein